MYIRLGNDEVTVIKFKAPPSVKHSEIDAYKYYEGSIKLINGKRGILIPMGPHIESIAIE
jgi:hypothetical protein